uniref:dnaJ homolog subfamily C member 1 isoform X2 n=1 Tax=Ciona intestinalis TaxID=7719 RepID=UPI000EF4E5C9|nr:dnaJ homolog subfamily C member 1 isoform X2 [Ciona intestinalis]|eukprot:XP_026693677.1 dnaJ homolog subfamily C member 1 isoform X2 [Ciona intestinalis]
MVRIQLVLLLCMLTCAHAQWGFSPEQTEIYDLVDEVGENFYEFINVTQDAGSPEIRRSYRKLSLVMHPDKNKTEGAEENFRILVAIYEVLKNKEKREIYDDVLANGLPAAYLYVPRQIRKMSLLEVSMIMSFVMTIGHMLIMWGVYLEKKLTWDERTSRKRNRKQKKKDGEVPEMISEDLIYKPTLVDLLPILFVRKFYDFIVWLPVFVTSQREQRRLLLKEEEKMKLEQERAEKDRLEQLEKRIAAKKLKQQRNKEKKEEYLMAQKMRRKKGEWNESDQSQLVKLMARYPGGTEERWVKISGEMGRPVHEVTTRARMARNAGPTKQSTVTFKSKIQIPDDDITMRMDEYNQITTTNQKQPDMHERTQEVPVEGNHPWSQSQQQLLEKSLIQFPKTSTERWDKISRCVPGKTKEECIARYKFLAEKVLQKKKNKN